MKQLIFLCSMLFCYTSCLKEKMEDPNEEELITTIGIDVIEQKSLEQKTFLLKDLDGPGGLPPQQFDTIKLKSNSVYNVQMILGNESVSPAGNIREEVESESDDHQFYFIPDGVAIQVSQLNKDSKGLDLGTISSWETGLQGEGSIRIVLKHKPGYKTANDGVDIGETDVEVVFPVVIR